MYICLRVSMLIANRPKLRDIMVCRLHCRPTVRLIWRTPSYSRANYCALTVHAVNLYNRFNRCGVDCNTSSPVQQMYWTIPELELSRHLQAIVSVLFRPPTMLQSGPSTPLQCQSADSISAGKGSVETDLRATGRHLPYGLTHCYLPPDASERIPP